jgi:hypothetical protein
LNSSVAADPRCESRSQLAGENAVLLPEVTLNCC